MIESRIYDYIQALCLFFELDIALVIAIGYIESDFLYSNKSRYEPRFYSKYILGKPQYLNYAPSYIACSHGYFQIMTTTAEMMGYDLDSHTIEYDMINIFFALKYMRYLYDTYDCTDSDMISAYNHGSPAIIREGKKKRYKNQKYVNKVLNKKSYIKKTGIDVDGVIAYV